MAVNLEQGWIQSYDDMIRVTYQQDKSEAAQWADPRYIKHEKAEVVYFDRMGMVVARDNPGRFTPTQFLDVPRSGRAVFPTTSEATHPFSTLDQVRELNNPQNATTQTMLAALRRREDLHWINAAVGSANVSSVGSDGSRTITTQAMLSGNKYDATGGSTAIIIADIIKAASILTKAGVPQGPGQRRAFYAAGHETDLMAISQASSSDFVRNFVHEKGTFDGLVFEGFSWKCIVDAQDETGTLLHRMLPYASSKGTLIFASKMAVGINVNQDITTDVGPRRDLALTPIQVCLNMTMGATRVWDTNIVQVEARHV